MSEIRELELMASSLRKHVIQMISSAGSGHPGGSLSAAEIITVLFFDEMNIMPDKPDWECRDRFVLSKGHAAPIVYAALAQRGFFPVEDLLTLRKLGSHLQGHPDMRSTKGIDMSTGSLGQGLSVANGMAIAAKMDSSDRRVYVLLGDGELQEGQIWEAAMTSSHRKLDNLVAFVDSNGLQIDGKVTDVKSLDNIAKRFSDFGWNAIEVDGHDINQIKDALKMAKTVKGCPSIIVAKTIKGKGVSFMEDRANWHGSAPNADETAIAIAEIDCLRGDV